MNPWGAILIFAVVGLGLVLWIIDASHEVIAKKHRKKMQGQSSKPKELSESNPEPEDDKYDVYDKITVMMINTSFYFSAEHSNPAGRAKMKRTLAALEKDLADNKDVLERLRSEESVRKEIEAKNMRESRIYVHRSFKQLGTLSSRFPYLTIEQEELCYRENREMETKRAINHAKSWLGLVGNF